MKIIISESDVLLIYRAALTRVAKCIQVPDVEWKANHELYEEIIASSSDLITPLENFLNSYDSWYKFHLDRIDIPELSNADRHLLDRRIAERDRSREDLINLLNSRGC